MDGPEEFSNASIPDDSHLFSQSLSESASRRVLPEPLDSGVTPRRFDPNASVVLIGLHGTGKSSLAVILSTATGRRLVDADQFFQQVTGLSRSAYKKRHNIAQYRKEEAKVMSLMLTEHREGCVIACGPGSMERSGQQLLKEYTKTHPVIHVVRDPDSIQAYLKAWDSDRVRNFMELSAPLYRACSNLEFFNVSETGFELSQSRDDIPNCLLKEEHTQRNANQTPFLTLKRVERDFLLFVAFATGNKRELTKLHSSFPLSLLPIESRPYTYAVSVSLSSLLEKGMDVEELESTADAFELRIDVPAAHSTNPGLSPTTADRISQAVAIVRRSIIVPIIYHVDADASYTVESPSRRPDGAYLNLVEHGLRLAPEFLTVDLSYSDSILSRIIAAKGSTRIIGHYSSGTSYSGSWDDEEYMARYERAARLGCDMVRLSRPAATIEDNFTVERFRHRINTRPNSGPPIIAYNTGPLGRLSCCFNPILTSVTHPSIQSTCQTDRDASITVQEAQVALFSSFALDPLKFCVFGANVTYSLSPAMHNAAYRACGMPHEYSVREAPSLRDLNALVEDPNFGGASVSLPYKTEVIPLLHSMSRHARAIGAVNTLIPIRTTVVDPDKQETNLHLYTNRAGPIKGLHGDNTDWIGIYRCIRRGLSPANAVRPSSTGLVIGAGGMARAAIYSMIHLGVQNIFLYNRTLENAKKLAEHYNRQYSNGDMRRSQTDTLAEPQTKTTVHVIASLQDPWPANYKQPTMVVSCIPAHSIGGVPAPNFEMPLHWLKSPTGGVVVELAYKPLNTPLIKQIRSLSNRGWVALDGLDVLPEQGFAQFELLTGRRAPRKLMRAVVLREYRGEEAQYDPRWMQSRLENLDGQDG
ncbi:hypothetical protein VTN77DRAFT_8792 [Rasamsonia byssochlamydoides]|uniref:uncharacterized protein n=1 Tax=Rasamsonia byssochlamydoides TaxID=89139 RepID=UPI003742A020